MKHNLTRRKAAKWAERNGYSRNGAWYVAPMPKLTTDEAARFRSAMDRGAYKLPQPIPAL